MKSIFHSLPLLPNRFYGIIGTVLFTVLVSCTEEVEMEPAAYLKNIAIDATLTNENKHQLIRVYYTQSFTENSPKMAENAMVAITSDDSVVYFFERDTLPGYYYSEIPFAGEPGKTYQLTVTNVDVNEDGISDNYEATATMANVLLMDSISYSYIPEWEATTLNCYAWDPIERNYYNFVAWVNGVMVTDTLYEFNATNDDQFNGNYTNGIPCQFLQDEIIDELVENGDTLTLEIDNIDQAYFDYITSAIKEYNGFNPMFGGLPANVYSNISNNAIGIFRVYTVNKSSVIVKDLVRKEN